MSQQPFGDIPLFRELSRILASGEGPLNLEIARQVALAVVAQAGVASAPSGPSPYAQAVRRSEEYVAGYSRLTPAEPATVAVLDRAGWATATLTEWRWLLEHLAGRFGEQMPGPGDGGGAAGLQAMMSQIGPLLMGIQTGTVIGSLASVALGAYDLPVPRDGRSGLLFVDQNVAEAARDYGIELDALRRWLALHHTARHVVAAGVPWFGRYLRGLLLEVIDSIEIDVSGIERRLIELQEGGMEALGSGLGAGDLLPIADTARRRAANRRLRALVALWEGYALRCADAIAPALVGEPARIDEAMTRRAVARDEGEALLARLLGLDLDRSLQTMGRTFCAAIVRLHGPEQLNRVWDAPDNLPTLQELRDPFAWIERVLGDGSDQELPPA